MPGILKTSTKNFSRSNSAPVQEVGKSNSMTNLVVRSTMSQIELSLKEVSFSDTGGSGKRPLAETRTYEIDREEVLFKKDLPALKKVALLMMPQRGPLMYPTGAVSLNSKRKTFDNDWEAKKFRNEMACKTPEEARKLGGLRSELVATFQTDFKNKYLPQIKHFKKIKASIRRHSDLAKETEKSLEIVKSKARALFQNEKINATKALLHSENDLSEEELEKRAFIFAEHKVERAFTRQRVLLSNKIIFLEEDIALMEEKKEEMKDRSLVLRNLDKLRLI